MISDIFLLEIFTYFFLMNVMGILVDGMIGGLLPE